MARCLGRHAAAFVAESFFVTNTVAVTDADRRTVAESKRARDRHTFFRFPLPRSTQLWSNSGTDIAPISESLTLHVPAAVSSVKLTTFNTDGSTSTTNLSGGDGSFTLPASSLVEAATFYTSSTPSLRKRHRIHPRSGLGRQ